MTRQDIQNRKDSLISEREKVMGQANALTGAIQDCDYWLARLDAIEKLASRKPLDTATDLA